MEPVARERVERGLADAGHHPPDAARRPEQRRRLPFDRRAVALLAAVDVEEVLELEHLAPAQLGDGAREDLGDVPAQPCRQCGRPGQQEVAGEDGHDVAPPRVDARHAPARLGLVDDVVVVQRSLVDELDRHRPGDGVGAGRARAAGGGVRGAQRECGADALPARPDEVRRNVGEEAVGGAHRLVERVLDPGQIVRQRRERQRLDRVHGTDVTVRREQTPSWGCLRTSRQLQGFRRCVRRIQPGIPEPARYTEQQESASEVVPGAEWGTGRCGR